jgi:hypothetical protein
MNRPWQTRITLLYAAALLLALVLRLAGLGVVPLSDSEAALALQAAALAEGQEVILGPHPAYLVLTHALMFVFHPSSELARFWPALAGSLLVLLSALFRRYLGVLASVLLAFFLAVDPSMLAVSRQAGSEMLAILLVVLAFGLWLRRSYALAGIAAGMAVLAGSSTWFGVLTLAAVFIFSNFRQARLPSAETPAQSNAPDGDGALTAGERAIKKAALFAVVTFFLAGTLFFTVPQGVSAAGGGLAQFLQGWFSMPGVPAFRLLLALLSYAFLPLAFGIWGGIMGGMKRNPIDRYLLAWAMAALLLSLVYPGRQVADLVWVTLPLWALSARQMTRLVKLPLYDRLPTLGQALLSVLLLSFLSMTISTMSNRYDPGRQIEYMLRIGGSLVMVVASTGLIAWGWSRSVALKGLALGAVAILGLYTLSAAWNAAGHSGRSSAEIWQTGPVFVEKDLLNRTIHDLTEWGPRQAGGPELVLVSINRPSIRWALRGVENLHNVSHLVPDANPAFVITAEQPDLALAAAYRGQGFTAGRTVLWEQMNPMDWARWLTFRSLPPQVVRQDRIIFWARDDLFPGGGAVALPVEEGEPVPGLPRD